jgi:hypothetical protein
MSPSMRLMRGGRTEQDLKQLSVPAAALAAGISAELLGDCAFRLSEGHDCSPSPAWA